MCSRNVKFSRKVDFSQAVGMPPEADMYSAVRVVAWFTWLRAFHWCRQFNVLSKEEPQRGRAIRAEANTECS